MPIYEYICSSCKESFAKLQRMGTAEGETECPACGSRDVQRQISACAIGGESGQSHAAPACSMGGG
jgi:putative FmdB family regulatory protein